MRSDSLGLFWEDRPPEKKPPPEKRSAPENTWTDSLPYFEEAKKFDVPLFDFTGVLNSNEELIFDTETYPNYSCICFEGLKSGRVYYIQLKNEDDYASEIQRNQLVEILKFCPIVGFNSIGFDIIIINAYLASKTTYEIWEIAQSIIVENLRGRALYQLHEFKKHPVMHRIRHIDLMQVAPGRASLKLYACRFHVKKVQDLPYDPSQFLTDDQKLVVLWYCINDLAMTKALRNALGTELFLRQELSKEYKQQMLSRSDAQVAEDVISAELYRLTNRRVKSPKFESESKIYYVPPSWVEFKTAFMAKVLDDIL